MVQQSLSTYKELHEVYHCENGGKLTDFQYLYPGGGVQVDHEIKGLYTIHVETTLHTRWFKPWPFYPLIGGHKLSPLKGHVFTIPKRSLWMNHQACVSFLKSHFTNMAMEDNHQEVHLQNGWTFPWFSIGANMGPMANFVNVWGLHTYSWKIKVSTFYFVVPNGWASITYITYHQHLKQSTFIETHLFHKKNWMGPNPNGPLVQ